MQSSYKLINRPGGLIPNPHAAEAGQPAIKNTPRVQHINAGSDKLEVSLLIHSSPYEDEPQLYYSYGHPCWRLGAQSASWPRIGSQGSRFPAHNKQKELTKDPQVYRIMGGKTPESQ